MAGTGPTIPALSNAVTSLSAVIVIWVRPKNSLAVPVTET